LICIFDVLFLFFIFQIKLDPALESSKEEDSNILVLPTGKRKSKPVIDNTKKVKKLSKKERKRLENILERKKKKAHVRFLFQLYSRIQILE
jgi:ATP-dependent RNA helicase DHX37/DHR1